MIRNIAFSAALMALVSGTSAMAANQCRNAKGNFIKCPTPAARPKTDERSGRPTLGIGTFQKPQGASNIIKGKDGKCRYTAGPKKGQFARCS